MLNANPTSAAPWLRVPPLAFRVRPVDENLNGRLSGTVDSVLATFTALIRWIFSFA
jgi:hypothetical protein